MGRYINWAELVDRYSQMSKLSGAESVGSAFIAYAEAEVDARLASVYSVPFDTSSGAPMTVKDLTIDLAMLKASFGKSKDWDRMNEAINDRIKMILDGKIAIIGADGNPVTQVGDTIWGSNEDYTPIFGMGDTLDFVVDQDRVDDENDARD